MSEVQHVEILSDLATLLRNDATLQAIYSDQDNQICTHIPQNQRMPVLSINWSASATHDRKDAHGYDGIIRLDHWTNQHGLKQVYDSAQRCDELLHNQPFSLSSGQMVLLQHASTTSVVPGDGTSHHITQSFRVLATST